MILLWISVVIKPGKRQELLNACRLMTGQTAQEKRCLGCRLAQDIDNENLISVEETWELRSYLEEHFRSDIFSALLGAIKTLGEFYEIWITEGTRTEGMAAIQAARSKKD